MRQCLVGHTGFVGSNLARQVPFDAVFNSSNISEIAGQEFDLVVCAGVRAVKWWANQNPEADLASIEALVQPMRQVKSRETIVISTIDVYPDPRGVDETTPLDQVANHAYGRNRLWFENEMKSLFPTVRIIRLPGLFGKGLKKNVIFDLVHSNGLEKINPRSVFQYYDLERLGADLATVRRNDLKLVNFATEPVATGDILARHFPRAVVGQDALAEAAYDMHTRHADAFGGEGHYLESASQVLDRLGAFLDNGRGQ